MTANHRSVRRVAVLIGVAVIGTATLSACGDSESSSDEVSIATIQELTGANSFNGQSSQAGVLTAVHEINAAGGIRGKKIKLRTYDAASNIATAQNVIRDATRAKPAVIVGALGSSETAAASNVIATGQVAWVTSSYPAKGTDTLKNFFANAPTGKTVASGTVAGLKQLLDGSLRGKKIAFAGLNVASVDIHLAEVRKTVVAGGGSFGPVLRDPISISSWTSQAAGVQRARADAIIVTNTEPNVATEVKALGVAGFKGPIVTIEGANSDSLLSAVNLPNFYVTRSTVPPKPGDPLYKAAIDAGQRKQYIGTPFFAKNYSDIQVAAKVLEKCGLPCPTPKFISTIKGLGNITVPNGAMIGPLNYGKGPSGLTRAQIWAWDPATKSSVPKSKTLPLTNY